MAPDPPASSDPSGPVGGGTHKVKQGQCIESIAFEHGHFWETIWDHAENVDVRQVRQNPNALLAGDGIFLPELRLKYEDGLTERRHRFRRLGVPSKLVIVLQDQAGQPRADVPYVLEIDRKWFTGRTDSRGQLQHPISPNARGGILSIGSEQYPVELGHIDPIATISGIQGRLSNLGFFCGQVDGQLDDETEAAIRYFQDRHDLSVSGVPDQATRDKLVEVYGS